MRITLLTLVLLSAFQASIQIVANPFPDALPEALPGALIPDSTDARDIVEIIGDLVPTVTTNAERLAAGLPLQRPDRLFDATRVKRQLPSNVPFSCNQAFATCCGTVAMGGTSGSMCSSNEEFSGPAWSVLSFVLPSLFGSESPAFQPQPSFASVL
jgi:hypothetical protein